MTRRRRVVEAAVLALFALPPPAAGQTVATMEVGPSIVEYDGFLVSGAANFSPGFRHDTPRFSFGTRGTLVVFESGNQILQGTAAGAWLTPTSGPWRAELSGSTGLSRYESAPGSGHILFRTRVHYVGGRAGGWVSGATGQSFGDADTATPTEWGIGGWTVQNRITLGGSLTGSRVDGSSYADLIGTLRWATDNVQFDIRAGARSTFTVEGYAEMTALARLNRHLSLTVTGGQYPTDPIRGVLGATYATVGLRVNLIGTPPTPLETMPEAVERAVRALAAVPTPSVAARLEIAPAAATVLVRVIADARRSVELIADFTDWETTQLTRVGENTWEISLPIPPGLHRFNVRIDGGDWTVPAGARAEPTEFGGRVGIMVIER